MTPVWRKASASGEGDCVEAAAAGWRTASASTANGDCVEVAITPGTVLVRDSKDPDGPRLTVSAQAWRAVLASIREG